MDVPIPSMIFEYGPDSKVERALCSFCGMQLPTLETPPLDEKEAILAFCIEFVRHVRTKHPGFIFPN
jgi:hypothetical protein